MSIITNNFIFPVSIKKTKALFKRTVFFAFKHGYLKNWNTNWFQKDCLLLHTYYPGIPLLWRMAERVGAV